MANKFASTATKETTLSPIMENRTKLTTADIISQYPQGITVTAFDFISGKDKAGNDTVFPVVAFAENPQAYFFGGKVMSNICNAWVKLYNGDITAASNDLGASGGVKLKLSYTTTRSGNRLVAVSVIE